MKIFLMKSERLHNYHFDASKSSQRDYKTNPYELSGLVQKFWISSLYVMDRLNLGFYITEAQPNLKA